MLLKYVWGYVVFVSLAVLCKGFVIPLQASLISARFPSQSSSAMQMSSPQEQLQDQMKEKLKDMPSQPTTTAETKLTYLEGNSWFWSIGGVSVLVDPILGPMTFFNQPALYKGEKKYIKNTEQLTKELAEKADAILLSQGFDDHCDVPTLKALASLMPSTVMVYAPPSASKYISDVFPPSRIKYLLPGDQAVLKSVRGPGRLHLRTTTGALLGPPWQQKENGYILTPMKFAVPEGMQQGGQEGKRSGSSSSGGGGAVYFEPHCAFDEGELSSFKGTIETVITPVVSQMIGPYELVGGGDKAIGLVKFLGAKNLVPMLNGDLDDSGLLGKIVTAIGSLEEVTSSARRQGINVVDITPGVEVTV